MSYLLDFVRTFTEDELTQFRHLDLKGKEELVRDQYAVQAKNAKFDEATLADKLSISVAHLDKINSVLLDKAIAAFYQDNYSKAFSAILNKGLSALMLHELKILEKQVLAKRNATATLGFYKAAFEGLRSMFHPNYNTKLTHQIGEKYLQCLGNKITIADESYVNMFCLYGDIVSAAYGGKEITFKPKAAHILSVWEKKIQSSKSAEAAFYFAYTRATFYKHFTEDAKGFLKTNEEALDAFRKSKGAIESKYEGIILCELGFGNIACDLFDKALAYYREAFTKFPDTVGKSTYQACSYFYCSILNKDIEGSKRIFDTYLLPKILPSTNRSVLFDIYLLAAWGHIYQRQYDGAFNYLNKLKQYGKTEITLLGHVMVRQLESAYFYLSGDIKTASITIGKNLRFIHKQKQSSSVFEYYEAYLNIIDKLIKMEQGKLRSPDLLKAQIKLLPGGMYQSSNAPLIEKFEALSAQA